MKRIEKAQKIGLILDKLYPETPIPLNHQDEYTLLVAVMLSAQSTDKKVNEITPKLFKVADTPEKMRKLKVSKIREIIREIGLAPTKAKNLKIIYCPPFTLIHPFIQKLKNTTISKNTSEIVQKFPLDSLKKKMLKFGKQFFRHVSYLFLITILLFLELLLI